jgi:hypothetical protein
MAFLNAPSVVIATRALKDDSPSTGSIIVRTPFELIRALEEHASISTAVLADIFAGELVIARFLRQQYPHLKLVTVPGNYSEEEERIDAEARAASRNRPFRRRLAM